MQLQGLPSLLTRRHVWLQADLGPLTPACRQSSAQHDFADPLVISLRLNGLKRDLSMTELGAGGSRGGEEGLGGRLSGRKFQAGPPCAGLYRSQAIPQALLVPVEPDTITALYAILVPAVDLIRVPADDAANNGPDYPYVITVWLYHSQTARQAQGRPCQPRQ